LAPRHIDVDRVNDERLKKLPGKVHVFDGVITGKFSEKQLPVPNKIELKIGAQVLIAKNSSKYVNGDVATVTEISSDRIKAMLASTKKVVEVPMNIWEQFDYKFNEETGAIERVVIGTYRQLPAVLAWAITIHKSQGLTLDRVHLDLGQGAFETGQTYVALSRCRSLETLTLSKAIQSSDIKVDPESTVFYSEIKK
jgi:ATP-dependent exoDNAse (exonuclease V) alpha subunit